MILLKKKNYLGANETAIGETIEIKNEKTEIKKFIIDGESTQETRSGKNLLYLDDIDLSGTKNSLEYTIKGNKITLNGTTTANTDIYLFGYWGATNENAKRHLKAGTYTFSCQGSSNISFLGFSAYYGTTNVFGMYRKISGTTTLENNTYYSNLYFSVPNGVTFNNDTFYIQLEEGSTYSNFEPYGASPSPDYPSEIKSVGYTNLFNGIVEIGSLSTTDGSNFDMSNRLRTSDYIKVNGNTKYTISVKSSYDIQSIIYVFDSSYNLLGTIPSNWTSLPYTFITDETVSYIKIVFRKSDNEDITVNDINNIQIEKGSIAHPYILFGKYGIEVKTVGKNLFDKDNFLKDYGISESGIITTVTGNRLYYFPVKYGNNYVFSFLDNGVSGNVVYGYCDELPTNNISCTYNVIAITNLNNYVFTPTNSTNKYLCIRLNPSNQISKMSNIQFEEGIVATEYKEYKSNTTVLALNEPLRSLPTGVKDIAYLKNDKLYVDRYVGSVILNGSESWEYNAVSQGSLFRNKTIINDAKNIRTVAPLSNNYVGLPSNNAGNERQNNNIYILDVDGQQWLDIIDNRYTNNVDFKNWLSTHNTELYYELATPVTEEVGDLTILELIDGENNISNSENANMKIEYVNYTPEIFEFNTILQSGYRINEQQNLISKKQFVNGKRKKINTSYTDVIINLDLGCFDGNTLGECLTNLTDGEYEYYSLKDKKIKNANFIVTLPELQVDNSACEVFVGDFTATLEKSSDVE